MKEEYRRVKRRPGLLEPEHLDRLSNALGGISGKDGREAVFFFTGKLVDPLEKNPPQTEAEAAAALPTEDLPYGIPVSCKPGLVFSPHPRNKRFLNAVDTDQWRGGLVDVTDLPPNMRVMCPYSRKHFLVP